MKKILFTLLACFAFAAAQSQSVFGTWKTKDDETNEEKSHVEIYEAGGKMFGKVVKLLRERSDRLCDKCPGDRKNQPVLNMIILVNMLQKDGLWQSGDILDPEKGKWYGCRIWLKEGDPNTLVVRGYLGPFYRTQYWSRVF
ncbi:MAG: DUF2147 domain-containing protein [Haliscomenobacteraceae bacterium CHB4]|nr:hypothetical protein [Saprospiraceae bacterium]MCE7923361.1 DUF2147 domain-containing protein [Haliscomenobacteraceae bacterium CHB4]